jgi:PmbA protein
MSAPAAYHDALAALLDHARANGADAAEASLTFGESQSVEVRNGALEGVERDESRSVALRAFVGKRQAAAAISDVSPAGLAALAERVVAMAKLAPEDPYCGLLDARYRAVNPPTLETADPARPDARALEALALACEAASLAVPGVTNSAGAGASFDVSGRLYATSDGFRGEAAGTSYSVGAQPLAERDGQKERDYEYRTKRFLEDLPAPEDIGRRAGERTTARLGARKLPSQTATAIFENRIAGRIVGPFLSAIVGAAVARGVSFMKDKLGQQVFPQGFEIYEDPFKRRGLSSRAFDGEGGAVRARALVDNGVATTWLLNAASARQLGLEPTGHATMGHGGPPGAGASNLTVKPGSDDLEALMRAAGKGLLVTEMFSPALNANTGDWSVGVAGYWFEGGAVAFPVSEVTVAGNLLEMYARLIAGADVDDRGGLSSPSLMVEGLALGGS